MFNAIQEVQLGKYNFSIVIEPDEDRWFACIPEFEHLGVATWGATREEAAKNLVEVAIMTFQDLARSDLDLLALLGGEKTIGA